MKTLSLFVFLVVTSFSIAPAGATEEMDEKAGAARAEALEKEQEGKVLRFLLDLTVVETNFRSKEQDLTVEFKALAASDIRVAANLATLWRFRARKDATVFWEAQSRHTKESKSPDALDNFKKDGDMFVWSYYLEHWEDIRGMIKGRQAMAAAPTKVGFDREIYEKAEELCLGSAPSKPEAIAHEYHELMRAAGR